MTRYPVSGKSTHSNRLERWVGAECLDGIVKSMQTWQGLPIAVAGVPGDVFVGKGGVFTGTIRGGSEASAADAAAEVMRKLKRAAAFRRQRGAIGDLGALQRGAQVGKVYYVNFSYAETAGTMGTAPAGSYAAEWQANAYVTAPAASASANMPGGTVYDSSTRGALTLVPSPTANTYHVCGVEVASGTTDPTPMLLYDRLFAATAGAGTANQPITGVPTRYQSTNPAQDDYAGSSYVTAINQNGTAVTPITFNITYANQSNANSVVTGVTSSTNSNNTCVVNLASGWFFPMAAGDVGVMSLSRFQSSGDLVSPCLELELSHPIAIIVGQDGRCLEKSNTIHSALNLTKVYDTACLSMLKFPRMSATRTKTSGRIILIGE